MASLPLSRGSTCSSSDSEESDADSAMLASCSLQEIRQEDLAAILPDQQECDAFGGFESRPDKTSPQTDDASGSDMELPQQAVNALIQRTTESSSENESHAPVNTSALFANSLLQQFDAQTQMLNAPSTGTTSQNSDTQGGTTNNTDTANKAETIKRKRGRPKKVAKNQKKMVTPLTTSKSQVKTTTANNEYVRDPNVSPDSGIQNSPDHGTTSPEGSPFPTNKSSALKDQDHKKYSTREIKIKSESNKTEHKRKAAGKPSTNTNNKSKDSINSITANRFDRVLYGTTERVLYPPRRKVGRPVKKGPGRPPKHKSHNSVKETVTASLPTVEENKTPPKTDSKLTNSAKLHVTKTNDKVETKVSKTKKAQKTSKTKEQSHINSTTISTKDSTKIGTFQDIETKKSKSTLLFEICERVSKRLELNNKFTQKPQNPTDAKQKSEKCKSIKVNSCRVVLASKNKIDKMKTKFATLKNAKLMHSKHKHKKHKKCKFKILKPLIPNPDPKINTEIEKLIADFMKLCNISTNKPAKENVPEILKTIKKNIKKRKASDFSERKKKKQNTTSTISKDTNSNEQRLPLKKRHYHLSNSESNKVEPIEVVTKVEVPQELIIKSEIKVKAKEGKTPVVFNKNNLDKPKITSPTRNLPCTSVSVVIKSEFSKSPPNSPKHVTKSPSSNSSFTKVPGINNNEYNIKSSPTESIGSHIDEAIEACINKFAENKNKIIPKVEETVETSKSTRINNNTSTITTTTPKKRHRLEISNKQPAEPVNDVKCNILATLDEDFLKLKNKSPLENVVTEMQLKRNLTHRSAEQTVKKTDNAAQIITRKKNRLEDLTSTLVSKTLQATGHNTEAIENQHCKRKKEALKQEEQPNRASVIKYPPNKKPKLSEPDVIDNTANCSPTGIFTPTIDLELHLSAEAKKNDVEIKEEIVTKTPALPKDFIDPVCRLIPLANLPVRKPVFECASKRKVRKRRAINRTGFPTVKRKKKKHVQKLTLPDILPSEACDRVPRDGEEYLTFMQRMEKSSTSAMSQNLSHLDIQIPEVTKWEVMSECDSLPQEDRIDFIGMDPKLEKCKGRDVSPATSVETRSSVKIKREISPDSKDDLDEITLEARMKRIRLLKKKKLLHSSRLQNAERILRQRHPKRVLRKRRLRETSPSSSVEPEKKVREEILSGDDKKLKKQPRWRKKCLAAGLFSDYYKENDEITKNKRNETVSSKNSRCIVYNPEEHPFGLLPAPYHCGKYLRCRKLPFQLPYDLWWMHTHSQLPGRDIVPSWNYRKIRTNVYNVKTTTGACEPQACNCSSTSGCGDDCINRLVLAECPAAHKCQNQKIQKHEWSPGLEKFMTEAKGWGIRTNLAIKNGEFILEYVGEVVSDQEFKERMATRYVHDTHHYCLHLDGGLVIDGHRMGGDGRFVNHSCEPNCEMQKWSVNGQFRMALFALRDIKSGEELTYDYNFSLFNAAEGQECKCGSNNCRGVIGGKTQRVRPCTAPPSQPGRVGRPRKNAAKKQQTVPAYNKQQTKPKEPPAPPVPPSVVQIPVLKPLTHSQKTYVLEHHCFLLRNLNKVKRLREKSVCTVVIPQLSAPTSTDQNSAFLNHLNALRQPRNMKTRRLAQVEDDPVLTKTAKLAILLRDLYNTILELKDENKKQMCTSFINLPSKRKCPDYYQRITEPIDLTTIEQNITTGVYKSADIFDIDMGRVFNNAVKFYGRTSELGIAATRLKKLYNEVKQKSLPLFQNELGVKSQATFLSRKHKNEEEDIIRCICGMYRDEGLMIQCERCLVWQHCECVQADAAAASYHCERCVPRIVDYEISMDEFTEHGHRYYMTLLRGKLQLRQGDTVYVLRDIPIPGTDKKHTYDTIKSIEYSELDIFRIERLWKDCKTGQRFAYGHHYLRPHETYHEPSRKFFPNEVMRVPLYEAVPVELIIEHCWVLDLNTYCKGRPFGASEEHIYICEYRVDKTARLFSKVSKSKFSICTKSYAFDRFDTRLKVYRTYTPHDLDPTQVKPRGRKPQDSEEGREMTMQTVQLPLPVSIPIVRTLVEQKTRLNKILLNLLSKMPTKQVLDVSYLLEGGRRRKKQT